MHDHDQPPFRPEPPPDDLPAAWLAAAAGAGPLEAVRAADLDLPIDDDALRDLLQPLPPDARARLAERCAAAFLADAPCDAPPPIPRKRRRWWISAPLAAAAAVVLFLALRTADDLDATLPGEVHAITALRAEPTQSTVRVEAGKWLFLECRAGGRPLTVVEVLAEPDPARQDTPPRSLTWRPHELGPDGGRLHIRAELPPGAWSLTCVVTEAGGDVRVRLAPPAAIVVE